MSQYINEQKVEELELKANDARELLIEMLTKVVDGDLCAVYSWYDNEFGYTNSLVDHVLKVASHP